jgi:uncharacterized protein YaiE (UPF0345 family)
MMFKSNEYFDGKVKSIAFQSAEGPSTIGAIAAGTYEFSTTSYEYMTVVSGVMDVQFPGEDSWITVEEGETFEIEPNAKFSVKATADVAYVCLYSETPLAEFEDDGEEEESTGCGCGCDN